MEGKLAPKLRNWYAAFLLLRHIPLTPQPAFHDLHFHPILKPSGCKLGEALGKQFFVFVTLSL